MDFKKIHWPNALVLVSIHLFALLAFSPWLFSWSGVIVAVLSLYLYGTLGINIGFHRLLSHRSFRCPVWLERFFVFQGACCLMYTPTKFVALHRMHHRYSDSDQDPHSPRNSLVWGHMGWVLCEEADTKWADVYGQYAKDVVADRFYRRFEKPALLVSLYFSHALIIFAAAFAISLLAGASASAALQFGLSILVWGVFVRTVAVWHITWFVNSAA
ncbi:MAG: fatty acid desaturase, partial [Planctomycetales bacterium]|nr:fatty acid desaturase [Planctomycetales bacterium]